MVDHFGSCFGKSIWKPILGHHPTSHAFARLLHAFQTQMRRLRAATHTAVPFVAATSSSLEGMVCKAGRMGERVCNKRPPLTLQSHSPSRKHTHTHTPLPPPPIHADRIGSNQHRRLATAAVLQRGERVFVNLACSGDVPTARVHASMAAMTQDSLVLFGGRASPLRPFNDVYVATLQRSAEPSLHWTKCTSTTISSTTTTSDKVCDGSDAEQRAPDTRNFAPPALWRHELVHVCPGLIAVIGGRTHSSGDGSSSSSSSSSGVTGDVAHCGYTIEIHHGASPKDVQQPASACDGRSGGGESGAAEALWTEHPLPEVARFAHGVCQCAGTGGDAAVVASVAVYGGLGRLHGWACAPPPCLFVTHTHTHSRYMYPPPSLSLSRPLSLSLSTSLSFFLFVPLL